VERAARRDKEDERHNVQADHREETRAYDRDDSDDGSPRDGQGDPECSSDQSQHDPTSSYQPRDRPQESDRVILVGHGRALGAAFAQLVDRVLDVVANQVQLVVAGAVGRVDCQFRWREREDEPPVTGVDRPARQYLAQDARTSSGFRLWISAWTPVITLDPSMEKGLDRPTLRGTLDAGPARVIASSRRCPHNGLDRVEVIDAGTQTLGAEIWPGIHHPTHLGAAHPDRGAQALIPRIIRPADRAFTADHGHTDRGSGSQKNDFQLRTRNVLHTSLIRSLLTQATGFSARPAGLSLNDGPLVPIVRPC